MRFVIRSLHLGPVLLVTLVLLVATDARAEAVYVTDELRLGLYRGELTEGRPFKTLISGDRMEVLERALMSVRVRTETGEEGWVKTAYLVDQEPPRRRAATLESANAALTTELEAARSATADANALIASLETELATVRTGIEDLPALEASNTELRAELSAIGTRIPLPWVVAGILAALLLGGAVGYLWLDRKVRSHFGGVRVY